MPEGSTEFSLTGLIGLIFGLMVVLVFIGLIFAQNLMSTVSDIKQSEQFDALTAAIGEVCGSQYHTSVWGRSLVVFEGYRIQYEDYATDFADPQKVSELGCNVNCLCLLRNGKAIKCKPMSTYEQQDCKNAKVMQTHFGVVNTRLQIPSFIIGKADEGCKYRLTLSWEKGDVVISGDTMKLTPAAGGLWPDWLPLGVGESC